MAGITLMAGVWYPSGWIEAASNGGIEKMGVATHREPY